MSRVNRRAPFESSAGDKILGLLLLGLAGMLAWWWLAAIGVDVASYVRVSELGQYIGRLGLGERQVAKPVQDTAGVAAAPPYCAPGQNPAFVFGFAEMKSRLGEIMGEPVECEHANADNGDALQQTSTGLAYYRRATNTPMFTDGWKHWALTGSGLVIWEGDRADPPAR